MSNLTIRNELKIAGMKHWQLADLLEISEQTMCRKLRHELPKEEQERIISLIREWGRRDR